MAPKFFRSLFTSALFVAMSQLVLAKVDDPTLLKHSQRALAGMAKIEKNMECKPDCKHEIIGIYNAASMPDQFALAVLRSFNRQTGGSTATGFASWNDSSTK
jgi:hypothetical protein